MLKNKKVQLPVVNAVTIVASWLSCDNILFLNGFVLKR